ncbi:P30/P32 family tip organella adhesin [Mycoplasmoides genitalium]
MELNGFLRYKKLFIVLALLFTTILIVSLSLLAFALVVKTNGSELGVVFHQTEDNTTVIQGRSIVEQPWFIPTVAGSFGFSALAIILGLAIGLPIVKRKEKRLLEEKERQEQIAEQLQRISDQQEQQTVEIDPQQSQAQPSQPQVQQPLQPQFQQRVPLLRPAFNPNMQQRPGFNQPHPNQFAQPNNFNPNMQQRPGFNPNMQQRPNPSQLMPKGGLKP